MMITASTGRVRGPILPKMAGDGLYRAAGRILKDVCDGRGTFKTLCFSKAPSSAAARIQNKKGLFAMAIETGRRYPLLTAVLDASQILEQPQARRLKLDRFTVLVVLHEFLLGKGSLHCSPPVKAFIEASRTRLHAELVRARMALHRQGLPEAYAVDQEKARYARINRCLVTDTDDHSRVLQEVTALQPPSHDPDVPDLLVLPAGTDLSRTACFTEGKLVLQDKASCFPPVILQPPPGAHVIDACAAPGNKTSQLAAMVGPTGRVYAFERDAHRYQLLAQRMAHLVPGAKGQPSSTTAIHGDFLAQPPDDPRFAHVTHILCDPSCSGSGMAMSLERALTQRKPNAAAEAARLRSLADFQYAIVAHAMKFPGVQRIAYSTCSVHSIENEEVVERLLRANPAFELEPGVLPSWPQRGLPAFPFASDVLRSDPAVPGGTNIGFFVALLRRRK